jgi:hypothetical protein
MKSSEESIHLKNIILKVEFISSPTSGAIYCGVPQKVIVVSPNGTLVLHKPKSTNLI